MLPAILALVPSALAVVGSALPHTDASLAPTLAALDTADVLVTTGAIDADGEWILVTHVGKVYASDGFDADLVAYAKSLLGKGHAIEAIECEASGTCFLSWSGGTWANGPVPAGLIAQINDMHSGLLTVRDVEITNGGGWVVVGAQGGTFWDGVPGELAAALQDAEDTHRGVQALEVGFDGGWALMGDQNPMFRGVSGVLAEDLFARARLLDTVDLLLMGPDGDHVVGDLDDFLFVPDAGAEPAHLVEYAGVNATIWGRMDHYGVTGATVALVRDGQVVSVRGYGSRDMVTQDPMLSDTPIHVASLSKLVGSLTALSVIDGAGHTVDTDVIASRIPGRAIDTWLSRAEDDPESYGFLVPLRPLQPSITYGRLMSHTASIPTGATQFMPLDVDASDRPTEDWLSGLRCNADDCWYASGEVVWQDAALGVPGDSHAYANRGFFLLQAALEDQTDTPIADLVDDTLAGPLGLESFSASYPIAPHVAARMAKHHDSDGVQQPWGQGVAILAGAMVSSAEDYARIVMVALNEGRSPEGEQLVPEASVAAMLEPEVMNDGTLYAYGYGVEFESTEGAGEGSGRTFVHTGLLTAHVSSLVCANPTDDSAIVVLTNNDGGGEFEEKLAIEFAHELGWADNCMP